MSGLINAGESLFLVIDVQENLLPAIADKDSVRDRIVILAKSAEILGVPTVLTEQAPHAIGHTVSQVRDVTEHADVLAKTHFNACREDGFDAIVQKAGRRQIVVAGMEAHVCVLQTVFGLLDWDYEVFVVADALGSRNPADKDEALRRMAAAGAVVTTAEMVAFEWMERSDREEFRSIHALLK